MRTSLCIAAALLLAAVLALTALAARRAPGPRSRTGRSTSAKGMRRRWRIFRCRSGCAAGTACSGIPAWRWTRARRRRSSSPASRPFGRGARAAPAPTLYTGASFGIATTGALDAEEMEREGMMAAPIAALYEKTLAEGDFPRLSEEEAEANQNAAAASMEIGPEEPTARRAWTSPTTTTSRPWPSICTSRARRWRSRTRRARPSRRSSASRSPRGPGRTCPSRSTRRGTS